MVHGVWYGTCVLREDEMLTPSQVQWAARHDWFLGDLGRGTILIADRYTEGGRLYETIIEWRDSFASLRRWAGY